MGSPYGLSHCFPYIEDTMTNPKHIDMTQSDWLRSAKAAALLRDPVDALHDAEALVNFAQKRLNALLSGAKT